MANAFDEVIRLALEVTGAKDITALESALRALGDSGSEAAPKAQELLKAISDLGAQSGALKAFVTQKAALVDLGNELFAAKEKAAALQVQFEATSAPTATLTKNLERANAAVASLDSQYAATALSVTKAENALKAAGVNTANLDAEQRRLQGSIAGVRAEAEGLASSLGKAAAAGEKEALTLSEVAERSLVLRTAFEQLKVILGTVGGFIALEEAKKQIEDILATGDRFKTFQIEFANAFGGAEQGAEALEKVKQLADQTPLSLDEVAKAALEAKKVGLDPFNGGLLALIEANERFGGSTEQLSGLITELGRAINSGEINLKLLTALQEAGVPAAQLLGNAIGKTATQVTELAKQGKLGADSVQTLIDALGKSGADTAAAKMATLGAQTTKLKDDFDELLKLIGDSGVYDFVLSKLKDLAAAFKEALDNGSLQDAAKGISDALIALGNGLVAVTKFVVAHRDGILEAAEAYAVFKTALLATNLVEAAGNWLKMATAVATNTTAVLAARDAQVSYATALKSTDAAAIAASAGSSGLAKFGSLIESIPKNVLIAIAIAGIEKDIELATKLYDTIQGNIALNKKYQETEDDVIRDRQRLVEISEGITNRLKSFADTEIASADALAAKNQKQSAAYIDSLQNAIRYFTALRAQARENFDFKGADSATAKLQALGIALQAARDHVKDLPADLAPASKGVAEIAEHFDELRAKGVGATTAIAGAFDGLELNTPPGLKTTIEILAQMQIRGSEAATAVQGELIAALQKLDGTDLKAFEENVSKKLQNATGDVTQLKTALGAALQAALLNLGVTAQEAGVQVTAAGQKIVGAFASVTSNAQASATQIGLAFNTALSKVTTTGEVQALEDQLKAAFDAGRISADQFTASMQEASHTIADLFEKAISSAKSVEELKTLKDELDAVAVAGKISFSDLAAATRDFDERLRTITANLSPLASQFQLLGIKSEANLQAIAANSREAFDAIVDGAHRGIAAQDDVNRAFAAYAAAARAAVADGTDLAKSQVEEQLAVLASVNNLSDAFTKAGASGKQAGDDTTAAYKAAQQAIDDAATAAGNLASNQSQAATATTATGKSAQKTGQQIQTAMGGVIPITEQASEALAVMNDIISRQGSLANVSLQQAKFLLTNLGALAGAQTEILTKRIEDLEAAAEKAKEIATQMADQAAEIQDQIDELEGNDVDIEARRHAKALQDITDEAKKNNTLNTAAYANLVKLEDQLHTLKLQHLKEQQAANDSSNGTGSGSGSSPNGSSPARSGGASGAIPSGGAPAIHITVNNPIGTNAKDLASFLAKAMVGELQTIQKNSRVNILTHKPN